MGFMGGVDELCEAVDMNELSLFSGYGGFSLGLRLAGIQTRTVAYVEWAKYPQKILKARIEDGYLDDAPIFSDISAFDGTQFTGLVDIITGGFPCQPHSVAGKQRGAADERNLWPDTLRVIREVEPRYVLLENVPGLISASSDGGSPAYGGTVVGELASIGYSVHWQTIGADDVGAPHRRKRWWCIGVADSRSVQRPQVWGVSPLATELQGRESDSSASRSADATVADSAGNGLHTSEPGIIREYNESSSSGEDVAETGRRSPSGELADSDRGRFEQRKPEAEPQTWASQPSERNDGQLADSSSGRCEEPTDEVRTGGNAPEYGISQLANSEGERTRRIRDESQEARPRWSNVSSGIPGGIHTGNMADSEGERYRGGSSTERGDGERVVQSEEQGWSEVGSETAGRNRELGDSQYDGRTTLSQLRGDEEAGTEWGTEKQAQTRESQGTDRPTNATGIRRGKSGSKLADSEGERRQRLQSEGGVSWEPQVPVGNRSRDEGLAYSQNTGLEGVRDCDYTQGRQDSDGSVGLRNGTIPTWPPSPSNASGWERVLRERPDLTPALEKEIESQFRGMDDGRSRRVDELKALGNGIVPAVVAEFLKRGIVAGWLS
jgi:DNA (cytosine-5)-methyltransferase 1